MALCVLLVSVALVAVTTMNIAADDLRLQSSLANGDRLDRARTVHGEWLATLMAGDPAPVGVQALRARADTLDHHADRVRELSAVAALAGLLVVLATASPGERPATRAETRPQASTNKNGKV